MSSARSDLLARARAEAAVPEDAALDTGERDDPDEWHESDDRCECDGATLGAE